MTTQVIVPVGTHPTLVTVPVVVAGRIAAAACSALVMFCVPPVIVRAVLKQY